MIEDEKQSGNLNIRVLSSGGLNLSSIEAGEQVNTALDPAQSLDLLHVLIRHHRMIFAHLRPDLNLNAYPCPDCGRPVQLSIVTMGYGGFNGQCQCGRAVTLDFQGQALEPFNPEMALARYRELEALMNLEIINNPHWQVRRAAGDTSFLRESKNFAAQDALLEEIERNGYTITDREDEQGNPIYEIEPLEE